MQPPHLAWRLAGVVVRRQRGQLGGACKALLALQHLGREALPRQRPIYKHHKAIGIVAANALLEGGAGGGWSDQAAQLAKPGASRLMWQTCRSGSCCRPLRPTERAYPVPVPYQVLQLTSPPNARSVQVNSSSWPVCGLRLAAAAAAVAAVVPAPPAAAPHVQTVVERRSRWLIV